MLSSDLITGVILAGGKSSRFGSNKALAAYDTKTMLEHTLSMLKPYCRSVIVSGEYPEYKKLNVESQPDLIKDIGPIGGIYSSIVQSDSPWLLIMTCDMPLINKTILDKVIVNEDHDVVIHKIESELQLFPMLIACNKDCISAIEDNIQNKKYAIRHLLNKVKTLFIPIEKEKEYLFKNINYFEDYITLNSI